MRQPSYFLAALAFLALSAAPLGVLAFGPPAGDEAVAAQPRDAAETAEAIKRAAEAQGDISPQTRTALQKAQGTMNASPAPGQAPAPKGGGGKTIYGDIIIHR